MCKIIDCFNIKGRGLITEIQHQQNGLPPGSILEDPNTGNTWIVKKRILTGFLLIADAEVFFDCETAVEHETFRFKTLEAKETAFQKELQKRKEGIYCYLLKGRGTQDKPGKNCVLTLAV